MSKLLNRSLRAFSMYAAIVLACSVPVYYMIVDYIWRHELKEHNLIVSESIKQNLRALSLSDSNLAESINSWNRFRPEMELKPVPRLKPDSTYNIYRMNRYVPSKGEDRFQGLITYFEINGKPYSLTVETNMEETYETIGALTLVTVIFFIILLGGFILLNRRISRKLWEPFYDSLEKINKFELNARARIVFEPTGISEFEALNHSLDKLIAGNIAAYKQQKEFTENASHELQTPIAIVQSKLDLLMQSQALTDEQFGIIEQIQHALARMNRVNKNLLLLAKIENSQFPERAVINLSELLRHNLELLRDFTDARELSVSQQIDQGVIVEGNTILVEILLENLLLNAIRHSPEQGAIRIELSAGMLRIANTGAITLQQDGLFKRFGIASAQAPGTGLGLALVRQISDQYGWSISYSFAGHMHIFSLSF